MYYTFFECQEANISKESFKDCGGNVRPVQHAVEPRLVEHVLLQGADKDLGGVAEDNDSKSDRK